MLIFSYSLSLILCIEYILLFLDTAEHIWKSVTSVSNAGKKRGRGKGAGKRRAKNLNRGQVIGVGKYLISIRIFYYYCVI